MKKIQREGEKDRKREGEKDGKREWEIRFVKEITNPIFQWPRYKQNENAWEISMKNKYLSMM